MLSYEMSILKTLCSQVPVLSLQHYAVAILLANGNAAFIESCAPNDWKDCDSVRSL